MPTDLQSQLFQETSAYLQQQLALLNELKSEVISAYFPHALKLTLQQHINNLIGSSGMLEGTKVKSALAGVSKKGKRIAGVHKIILPEWEKTESTLLNNKERLDELARKAELTKPQEEEKLALLESNEELALLKEAQFEALESKKKLAQPKLTVLINLRDLETLYNQAIKDLQKCHTKNDPLKSLIKLRVKVAKEEKRYTDALSKPPHLNSKIPIFLSRMLDFADRNKTIMLGITLALIGAALCVVPGLGFIVGLSMIAKALIVLSPILVGGLIGGAVNEEEGKWSPNTSKSARTATLELVASGESQVAATAGYRVRIQNSKPETNENADSKEQKTKNTPGK
jgi:hypothetical protein